MIKYRNINLTVKSLLPIVFSLLIITITLVYYILPQIKDAILEKKKEGLKNVVELAYTTFAGFDKEVKAGEITLDTAKIKAEQIIKYMRFEGENYYFVFDFEKMLIQPVKIERENKPLSYFKDDHNNQYLIRAVEICKSDGEGFVFYYRTKPKTDITLPKLSYVRLFKPWGWIIGAGVYFDDIEKEYANIRNEILAVFLTILLLLMIISYFNTKYAIIKPIKKLKDIAREISNGNFKTELESFSNDEIGNLSQAFSIMIINIKKLIDETKKSAIFASEGKLDYRSDINQYSGAYRELLTGLNNTMNEIISPLNLTAEYIDRISKGDMPAIITDVYNGDFNEIKGNLNLCIDAISSLISDINEMNNEIITGNLRFRISSNKHHGRYREIIEGINATIDRLVDLIDKIPLSIQISDTEQNILFINKKSKMI